MDLFGLFLIWGLLSAGVAGLANSRGRSAFGYFLLSFFFSPLLGLIVVLVTRNLAEEEAREAARKREHEKQLESLRALANVQGKRGVSPETPSASPVSVADELEKLANLRDKGVLTVEEFEQQKKALLQRASS